MARNVEDTRNIVVCGHGSSGKTTLIDHLLVKTGAVTGQPSVDAGTSICDFDEEEKHHKHSIEATVVHFDHNGKRFNLIDTPGYPDLIGQTIGAAESECSCGYIHSACARRAVERHGAGTIKRASPQISAHRAASQRGRSCAAAWLWGSSVGLDLMLRPQGPRSDRRPGARARARLA